jgi:hypothetical protein
MPTISVTNSWLIAARKVHQSHQGLSMLDDSGRQHKNVPIGKWRLYHAALLHDRSTKDQNCYIFHAQQAR